ncbi:leukocyte receptor cluster member 1 homolog [Battus philenor]|uniref:leukocyte receptor cluster member 1 homolog n=1 Tax=Battus philenor TaxID=42288 RepID=UPI0035CF93FB
MNILPKKRWHVRTKENIARVRKDEAEAAEKEKLEKLRTEIADREARLMVLKQKSKQKLLELDVKSDKEPSKPKADHINLFADLEHSITTKNKEHEKEDKEKKEEYEKKIGYLTYLGQDTNEKNKKKNWYEVVPEESRYSRSSDIKDTYEKLVLKDPDGKPKKIEIDVKDGEVFWKQKQKLDPINSFRAFCSQKNKMDKKANVDSSTEQSNNSHKKIAKSKKAKEIEKDAKKIRMQKMREQRIKREQQEKYRTEMFLKGLSGACDSAPEKQEPKIKPKYNSQYNPELARQNYIRD